MLFVAKLHYDKNDRIHPFICLKCIVVIFSAAFQDKFLKYLVKIFVTNGHLFYNYNFFSLSVCKSFAAYGRNCSCLIHIALERLSLLLEKRG